MISKKIQEIITELKKEKGMHFFNGTTEEQIVNFENINHLKLPEEYREWLKVSDGGELYLPGGVQIYGVSHKPIISFDDSIRPNDNYYVIGSLASGDPILCEKNSERISIYNLEAGIIEEDEIYESFIAFIDDLFDMLGIGE